MVNELQHLLKDVSPVYMAMIIAAFGGIVYQIKGVPKNIFEFISKKVRLKYFHTVTIFEYDDLYELVEEYFAKNYNKQYTDVQAFLYNPNVPDPNQRKRTLTIRYKQAPNLFSIKRGGKRLFVTKQARELNHAQSFSSLLGYSYQISGFIAKQEIDGLLKEIVDDHCKSVGMDAIRLYANDDYGNWCNCGAISVRSLESISLENKTKSDLILGIDSFKSSQEWYAKTGIPYKLTYLFHGPPGTGKTSLAKAISLHTGRDIYYLNLSILKDDAHLQQLYKNIPNSVMLLIEDIDAAFTRRQGDHKGITFSGLINCMDGVFSKEGMITCITTNHIDQLDPALIRPGRVDKVLKIDYPNIEQINKYLTTFYESDIELYDTENHSVPMSEVQEICIINRDWKEEAILEIIKRLNKSKHLKKAI